MSLFKERIHYKPFDYDWAFESYDTMQKMHWLPSEVPLHEDIRDWNERLTKEEKNLINQILKFFTQGDVDIAKAYLDNYIPKFKPPEIRMMLSAFASSEANHAHAYALLNDTLGEPELLDFKAFQEYKEMSDKHEYLFKDKGKIAKGEKLVEWDPYTRPIISEKAGKVQYVDLIDRVSIHEEMYEETGICSKRVIDWRGSTQFGKSSSKIKNLTPRLNILGKNGKLLKLDSGAESSYEIPVDAILSVNDGNEVLGYLSISENANDIKAVSYTHLTLPTILLV